MAGESLASLYAMTPRSFELIVVDPAIPDRYPAPRCRRCSTTTTTGGSCTSTGTCSRRGEEPDRAGGHHRLRVPPRERQPVQRGLAGGAPRRVRDVPSDVAAPLIREGRGEEGHFDPHLGSLVSTDDGRWKVERLTSARDAARDTEPVEFVEQHCLLFRRSVFDRIGPYDEELNTRDEVDLSLALHHAGATVVLEPRSIVNYVRRRRHPSPTSSRSTGCGGTSTGRRRVGSGSRSVGRSSTPQAISSSCATGT